MRSRNVGRAVLVAVLCVLLTACGGGQQETSDQGGIPISDNQGTSSGNEIPTAVLGEVLRAHQQGLGHMERYEYPQAVAAFREVHEKAPGWSPGAINLAIALLNQGGETSEEVGDTGAVRTTSRLDEALALLGDVFVREPRNPHVLYCRGIILEYLGRIADAHEAFEAVTEIDPGDGHAWYKFGATLPSERDPNQPAGPERAPELIAIFTRALECNPYLVPAMYKLQQAYSWDGKREKQAELIALFQRLNPKQNVAAHADTGETTYGEMGRYAAIIDWNNPAADTPEPVPPPRFEAPSRLKIALPEGDRWANADDFHGSQSIHGRARARFGVPLAVFDVDGDGRLDLYLAGAVVGAKGVRDVLLRNQEDGGFEDVTKQANLPLDRASLGVAAGDFDADGRVDLFLTGIGDNRLLRNEDGTFQDVTDEAGLAGAGPAAVSPTARFLDLDQDGDLDLYIINHTAVENVDQAFQDGSESPTGLPNTAYQNVGMPPPITGRPPNAFAPSAVATESVEATGGLSIAFRPWPVEGAEALVGGAHPHTGVALLDLDDDRDLDLVLAADGKALTAAVNDRLGRFHTVELSDVNRVGEPVNGLLVTDLDRDGRSDLVVIPRHGRLTHWRNRMVETRTREPRPAREDDRIAFEFWPGDAHDWRSATAVDLDLDGRFDLLGLPAPSNTDAAPEWARNAGNGLKSSKLALGPDDTAPLVGLAAADLVGDPLPDLVLVRDGDGPFVARNLGNGNHWLALTLSGRWNVDPSRMRTNPHGLGASVLLQGPGFEVPYLHSTVESGPSQSVAPAVLGLGDVDEAALVRLTWPDGVMQCELNKGANQAWTLAENNRKTGSCPVLFTWNGRRFVCIGDFLGGGGLGYLIAPGVYSQPDRDEAVFIRPDQLAEQGGQYRIAVAEPMDEIAYLDHLALEVVDCPPGVKAHPDERFAPGGNRPTGERIAWREEITPLSATDLDGRDITDTLAARDRRTADGFRRLDGWIGYAEEHGIILDFGDRLARFGTEDRLVLCLDGWVEYPYSQTNYAASTAGHALRPPILERRQGDGSWEVIEPDPGYPAGLPRRTTLDLTGKLNGPSCVLRIRTNMECYYDRAFVAVALPREGSGVRSTTLPVARADLGYRGYLREVSPDGGLPLIYDHDYVDPAPLVGLSGNLTRYGVVTDLLTTDDDQFCIVGPGDEATVSFDAEGVPPLPDGWVRGYVLHSYGYCKDADPFTATSDTVGPLPWRGMGPYPFGPDGARPADPEYLDYLETYQTRSVGR